MDDRPVPSELAESGLQADRNVEQVAVADRVLDGARLAERADVRASWMTVSPSVK